MYLEIYAWSEEDLMMCQAGYGLRTDFSAGVLDPFNFTQGLYECGKSITSTRAGSPCKSESECTTTISGIYTKCQCSYSQTNAICGIAYENAEYQEYISAVSTLD